MGANKEPTLQRRPEPDAALCGVTGVESVETLVTTWPDVILPRLGTPNENSVRGPGFVNNTYLWSRRIRHCSVELVSSI